MRSRQPHRILPWRSTHWNFVPVPVRNIRHKIIRNKLVHSSGHKTLLKKQKQTNIVMSKLSIISISKSLHFTYLQLRRSIWHEFSQSPQECLLKQYKTKTQFIKSPIKAWNTVMMYNNTSFWTYLYSRIRLSRTCWGKAFFFELSVIWLIRRRRIGRT